jgi:hypothetical protein
MLQCAVRKPLWAAAMAALLLWGGNAPARLAYSAGLTPESYEVRASVAKAAKYLQRNEVQGNRMGEWALVGLALVKAGIPKDDPKVLLAANNVKAYVGNLQGLGDGEVYDVGTAIPFLCIWGADRERNTVQALIDYLFSIQKPHGGWGYRTRTTGDTSMTQLAVLACWEAKQLKVNVPNEGVERVVMWLMHTQDPGGGFGYQGKLSLEGDKGLVQQSEVRPSLSAGGVGAVYVCYDFFGFNAEARARWQLGYQPPGLKEVNPAGKDLIAAAKLENPNTKIEAALFQQTQNLGNRWIEGNYPEGTTPWAHYYLYALERYWSFRELAEGPSNKSRIDWYTRGATHLINSQEPGSGRWSGSGGPMADTAFSILFLVRSMRKSIQKARSFGDGTLVGGRGLPKDTDSVRVRDGVVVSTLTLEAADQALAHLDGMSDYESAQQMESLAEMSAKDAEELLSKHARTLRRLAGGNSPEARAAAVQALGRSNDLDNVPTLIHALGDPDSEVVCAARDSLMRLARKFDRGFGPSSDQPSEAERQEAIKRWRAWYAGFRPDVEVGN